MSQESLDEPLSHLQDDHATDEEKLASSTSHKWASLHDADLNSVQHDFPEPCDLTSFVNENSLSPPAPGEAQLSHHFPFVLKPPSTCVQIIVQQRQMVLRRNSGLGNTKRAAASHSLPSSNTIDFSCGLLAQFSTGLWHSEEPPFPIGWAHTCGSNRSKVNQKPCLSIWSHQIILRFKLFLLFFLQLQLCISASVQDYEIEYMEKIGSSSAVSIKLIKKYI